jgi:hypothetical protein
MRMTIGRFVKRLRLNYNSYLQHFFPGKHSTLMTIFTDGVEFITIDMRLFQCLRINRFFCRERSESISGHMSTRMGPHQRVSPRTFVVMTLLTNAQTALSAGDVRNGFW